MPTEARPLVQVHAAAERAGSLFLLLLAFTLAISTSLLSISALLVLLCWLLSGGYRDKGREILANPVCLALGAYLLLLVAGLFWTENLANGFEVLKDRWKIMLLPVFLTTVHLKHRHWYAAAFVAGVGVAMGFTFLARFDLVHYSDMGPNHLTRGTFHVVYNPLLAFAIYLVLHAVLWGRLAAKHRLALSLLAAVMVMNMFMTEGRTGQLAFLVLVGLLLLQAFRKRLVLGAVLCACLLPLLAAGGYLLSPVFKQRVDTAVEEVRSFEVNPETSVGYRLLYWKNTLEIIRRSPWIGVGTGDFTDAYAEANRQYSPHIAPTDNPHNQYLLVASQSGLLGLLLVFSLFATLFHQARTMPADGWQRVRFALPVLFMTIMLTESYLVVYETGFLFSLFAAVLYKLPVRARRCVPA